MRRLLLALALMCIAAWAGAQTSDPADFSEVFSYTDGSVPPDWIWTCDTQGGGQFAVQDSQFVHLSGGPSSYVRIPSNESTCNQGWYRFDVKDSNWEFAWGIYGSPDHGWCCRLYHGDARGQPGFTVAYSEWSVPPECPSGQYTFHEATDLYALHCASEPLVGWHHITIEDILGGLRVIVDSTHVIFDHWSLGGGGFVGLGASAGGGELTPAFDNLEHLPYYSPVEEASWGSIKAMFR